MFEVAERDRVRQRLLDLAAADPAVTGAAMVGSYAGGGGDRWSDIDLALAVDDVAEALERWTGWLAQEFQVLHHWDLPSGATIYRVFLLPNWLEVDIGFKPAADFGARGPNWRTVFGEARQLEQAKPPQVRSLAGMGWHHALHAHVCIKRERWWQAVHWINALRDQVFTLACVRLGLSAAFARELHLLPAELTGTYEASLVRSLDPAELHRALRAVIEVYAAELEYADPALIANLRPALAVLH